MSTARSRQEAAQAIENHLREHMHIRLGPNAAAEAAQGGPVRLSGSEAEYAAYLALEALEQAGLVVVGRCVCGQPLGTCTCGDPRCGHCDSPGDECTPAEPYGRRPRPNSPASKIAESCGCCSIGTLTEAEARHTAANDPASTIRRCDAELAILDAFDATPGLETAVRLLAESYGIAVPRTVPTGTGWPQPGTGRA